MNMTKEDIIKILWQEYEQNGCGIMISDIDESFPVFRDHDGKNIADWATHKGFTVFYNARVITDYPDMPGTFTYHAFGFCSTEECINFDSTGYAYFGIFSENMIPQTFLDRQKMLNGESKKNAEQDTDALLQEIREKISAWEMGTVDYYEHSTKRVTYTDGVKTVAETCGAYWLIDAIASHQRSERVKNEEFQVWKLEHAPTLKKPRRALLTATDGNNRKIGQQEIPFTDFPLPEGITIWVEGNVILLPIEH
jgi:hypothetical protein